MTPPKVLRIMRENKCQLWEARRIWEAMNGGDVILKDETKGGQANGDRVTSDGDRNVGRVDRRREGT